MAKPERKLQRFLARATRLGHVTQFEIDDCIRRFDKARTEAEKTAIKERFLKSIYARMESESGNRKA